MQITTLSAKTDAFVKLFAKRLVYQLLKPRWIKTIPTEFVESYLSGETVNFFCRFCLGWWAFKIINYSSRNSWRKSIRLSNTPFDLEKTKTYAKISFFLDEADKLDIPFGELDNASYPFTGRGFTGSKNIILPEYKLMEERKFLWMEI